MENTSPTVCGVCGKGTLIVVNLGKGPERILRYRCSNPDCNVRFDEHGYERYNMEAQDWERLAEG